MSGRLPGFLVIGAMKSGTTTLHAYLARHPRVFLCSPKEPGFFSRDGVYARGPDWYASLFADAREDQLCGEASTCYTRRLEFPHAAPRIAQALPDAKLLYIVRHPIERSYAHYRHLADECRVRGDAVPTFETALEQWPTLIDTSLYLEQLAPYLETHGRESLLCLRLDALSRQPAAELARVQRFLDLPERDLCAAGELSANPSGTAFARQRVRSAIRQVSGAPLARALRPWLPARVGAAIRRGLTSPALASALARRLPGRAVAQIPEPARRRLAQRLDGPTRELARFLGEDLDAWLR